MDKPKLYLFVGYPGAGKTTVSKVIEEATGAMHIWSDQERQKMFDSPTHSRQESNELYAYLNEQTRDLLSDGKSVIFDTNFNHKKDRDHLKQIAEQNGAETIIVWVNTPVDLARERAVHSQILRNGYDFTMSKEQFNEIASKLEEPEESEKVLKIDGTKVDDSEIRRLLDIDA